MMATGKTFEEGLQQRKLLLPWCKSCGKYHFYPRSACPHCWSEDYEWRDAKGTGTVHSFTITRANPPTSFINALPYAIAIVELDEGVRMLTNIIDWENGLEIGDRVKVTFVEREGRLIHAFRKTS